MQRLRRSLVAAVAAVAGGVIISIGASGVADASSVPVTAEQAQILVIGPEQAIQQDDTQPTDVNTGNGAPVDPWRTTLAVVLSGSGLLLLVGTAFLFLRRRASRTTRVQ